MKKVRWGVLGVAQIAVEKVIRAMQQGECCEIEDAVANMSVIDAMRLSAGSGNWESPDPPEPRE